MSVHSFYSVLPKLLTTDARGFRMALMEFVSQLTMVPVPPAGSLGIVRCLLCAAVIDTHIPLSIRHFRNKEKETGNEMRPTIVSGIVYWERAGQFKQRRRRRQRERQKSSRFGFTRQLLCTCITRASRVHHAFLCISLPSLHDCDVKLPNFTFCVQRELKVVTFIIFSQHRSRPLDFNFRKIRQLLTN